VKKVLRRAESYWLFARDHNLRSGLKVRSHLTSEERVKLYQLSLNMNTIAEIGSYIGASANCFGAAMLSRRSRNTIGRIYCIDTWKNDAMTEGSRDTWQEFKTNTRHYKQYILPIKGFSVDVVEEVAAHTSSLDLLFIDGDHSYKGVKSDWDAYSRFLRSGSLVVFHDWGWADGVKRVIEENVMPMVSNSDSLPNMWWGKVK